MNISTWKNEIGVRYKTPAKGKLNPTKLKSHAELRRFVFCRDGFKCQICNASLNKSSDSNNYDGSHTLSSSRECYFVIDHVIPKSKGGINHPSNLQMLCSICNGFKGDRCNPVKAKGY